MGSLETDSQLLERNRLHPENSHRIGSRPVKTLEVRQTVVADSGKSSFYSVRRRSRNLKYHRKAQATLSMASVAAMFLHSEMVVPGDDLKSAGNRYQTDVSGRSPMRPAALRQQQARQASCHKCHALVSTRYSENR